MSAGMYRSLRATDATDDPKKAKDVKQIILATLLAASTYAANSQDTQVTSGDQSPAISGVSGDVNIDINNNSTKNTNYTYPIAHSKQSPVYLSDDFLRNYREFRGEFRGQFT